MSTPLPSLPPTLRANPQLCRWVDFNTQGLVKIYPGKVEIGQGIVSAIAQIAAEELDIDFSRVHCHPVDTSISPNEGSTSGSRSIQEGGEAMRQACAEIKSLFIHAAATRLGVTPENLQVRDGRFQTSDPGTSLTYWDLVHDVDLNQHANGKSRPKAPATFKTVGLSLPRLDLLAKVTGAAFIQDLELPDMLHGRVVRPPSFKAKLLHVDIAAIESIKGVSSVVQHGGFLGVIANREELAIDAMNALSKACVWEQSPTLPAPEKVVEFLLTQRVEDELLCNDAAPLPDGDIHELEATFSRPYLAHASIGPSCALAWFHDSTLEIWSHSQSIYALRDEIAKLLQMPTERVVVRHAEGSGCYGHNGEDDVAFDAALLALAVPGQPVRLQWTREDEFAWEPLGPAMVVKLAGKISKDGSVLSWQEEIWGNRHIGRPGRFSGPGLLAAWYFEPGIEPPLPADMPLSMGGGSQRNAVPYYEFPVKKVVNHVVQSMPIRVSALRALGAYINVFAIETFMDEMAHSQSIDPIEILLRHLTDFRAVEVIHAVARMANWKAHEQGETQYHIGDRVSHLCIPYF